MAKLGEFIKAQALKAGVDMVADNNKAFVEALATLESEIPDHVTELINRSLISVKEAKNNHGELKNHYTAQALSALDSEIDTLANDMGLTDADKDELKLEKSSYKRTGILAKKIQALTEAKSNATKPDQAKIAAQIAALNGDLAAEKAKIIQMQTDFATERKDTKTGYILDGLLGQYKTIYDTLPGQARSAGIRSLLNDAFRNNGVKLDLNTDGELVLLTKEGQNYFDPATNTQQNAKQFIEKTLAANKLLVTTSNGTEDGSQGSAGPNNQNGQGNNGNNQNGNNQNGNNQSTRANTSLLKSLNKKASDAYNSAPQIV